MRRVREFLKRAALLIAAVLIGPALASFWLRSLLFGPDRALEGSTQALALLPGISGQYLRRAFLRRTLAHFHPTATVEFGTIFSQTGARIEANAYVGPGCYIGRAHIGKNVLIAAAVHIPSGPHTHGTGEDSVAITERPQHRRTITIGAGTWIGSATVIMADIGRNCVVGAGAVVTRPLADDTFAVGVPARPIGSRRTAQSSEINNA